MSEVYLSVHAQRGMQEREVTYEEVVQVVKFPETQYRGPAKYGERNRIYQRGNLAVVVHRQRDGSMLVHTVLWRTTEQWTDDEMKEGRQ